MKMYALELSARADRIFKKMSKKEKHALGIIDEKILQIRENPQHFKPLSGEMHGERRVHIESSFVLTYEIDEKRKVVKILNYEHHDKVYGRN